MDERELRRRFEDYRFYHIIPLGEGLTTPGSPVHVESQAPVLAAIEQLEFEGKRVLDVGCRDGLYSFAAERRGAAEIIGIDNNRSVAAVELLIPYLGSKVVMHELNLYDLTPDRFGTFDVIIFAGVLYHLRHPFWGLRVLRDLVKPGGTLVLETAIFYGVTTHPMLYCPVLGESPYGPSSCSFFNRKGLSDSLESLGWTVMSSSVLHPDAEQHYAESADPVIDRTTLVCRFTGEQLREQLELYWHGTHRRHTESLPPIL
jgi:2-polyprenyl-3-methyl-5-hydroxy-6-metoxy-1,4-benzoquinol methylase